jgi:hypothetical protein
VRRDVAVEFEKRQELARQLSEAGVAASAHAGTGCAGQVPDTASRARRSWQRPIRAALRGVSSGGMMPNVMFVGL